jgi:hypothetical protein
MNVEVGAVAAIEEITRQTQSLQLCQSCAEALERFRTQDTAFVQVKLPNIFDRINRVLMFMSNYQQNKAVIQVGMDALLAFARNPDAHSVAPKTQILSVIAKILMMNESISDIVWRICLCMSIIVPFSDEFANQLVKLNVHDLVANNFDKFEDPKVRQQIIWMLASYLVWPKSRRIIHESALCIDLFQYVLKERNDLMKSVGYSTKVSISII